MARRAMVKIGSGECTRQITCLLLRKVRLGHTRKVGDWSGCKKMDVC